MDKEVQTYKVLSISPEGVFQWNEPEQLFTRGLNYADWAKFNYVGFLFHSNWLTV